MKDSSYTAVYSAQDDECVSIGSVPLRRTF